VRRVNRPVYFVKYWDKGSTAMGGDQMVPALERLGVPARVIHADDLPGVRDAVLVFIKRADILHLAAAWTRGNRCVLDVQDQVVFRRWISHWPFYHAFIFRNRRQLRDFGRQVRLLGNLWARSRTIYQHWDPRYRTHLVPNGDLRAGYLGIRRSLALWERLPGVEFVGPGEWFDRAPGLNVHLSIRAPGREWRYKPNNKVVTAAACGAVLITTPDCSSVELLGEDYPFYVGGSEPETVAAALARAAAEIDGPLWRDALERLRAVKEATAVDRAARQYVELFEELG